MKVNLKLLVPDWLLQYDTWREFLEVLEESVNEVVQDADDIRDLYDLEKAKDFIYFLARNFGFGEVVNVGLDVNKVILDNVVGFVKAKSSKVFFEKLYELVGVTFAMRDLSKETIKLSAQKELSGGYLQDGKYYRDGSVEVMVPVDISALVKELERFISAGVFVWYFIITGAQWLGFGVQVSAVEGDVGKAEWWKVGSELGLVVNDGAGKELDVEVRGYEVVSYGVVVDLDVGSSMDGKSDVGVSESLVSEVRLSEVVEFGGGVEKSADLKLYAESENYYYVLNTEVVVLR